MFSGAMKITQSMGGNQMAKKLPFQSPMGTARYPHISSPDSTGKFADNKFKVQIVVPKAEAEPFVQHLNKLAKELDVSTLPYKVDKDDPSMIVFTAKSKFKPLIFDAKNNEVKRVNLKIGSGSKLRVSGIVFPYDTGVSLQMNQVQVIELVDGANSMFDAVEGSFDASDFDDGDSASSASSFDAVETNGLDI